MPAPTKPYAFSNTPTNTNVIDADQVNADFDTLYSALANAAIGADQLSDAAKLGVSGASTVRRGATNISATESRTNTAYGTLTTPDKVSSIVLPSNGLIAVAYQATWQESVSGAGRAAIFIGANQLRTATSLGTAGLQEAMTNADTAAVDHPLTTYSLGLVTSRAQGSAAYPGDVTTGQVVGIASTVADNQQTTGVLSVGGACHVFAAAGTYDIAVMFKSSSGSVTAKNRKLWVWTIGF